MKNTLFILIILTSGIIAKAQLLTKFPNQVLDYKQIGKPDCTSMNITGIPPMNTCSQKYSNGKLIITISLTEYPKGNPTIVGGNDQGDDSSAENHSIEKIAIGKAKGTVTFMKKTKMATASMAINDRLIIDINGANQPNTEAVKALAKALKL